MTSKQKLALVAAQYVAQAREMTRSGDLMAGVASSVDEAKANDIMEALEREGLVDENGILQSSAERVAATKVFGKGN